HLHRDRRRVAERRRTHRDRLRRRRARTSARGRGTDRLRLLRRERPRRGRGARRDARSAFRCPRVGGLPAPPGGGARGACPRRSEGAALMEPVKSKRITTKVNGEEIEYDVEARRL